MSILSNIDKKNMIDFLVRFTNYSRRFYESMHDAQLCAVYMKYSEKRNELIKDLLQENNGYNISGYSKKELCSFKIGRLQEIFDQICNELSCSNDIHERDNDREYSYLSRDELAVIYGLDLIHMTDEDLRNEGFIVVDGYNNSMVYELKDEVISQIITFIVKGEFKDDNGYRYTAKKLSKLSFDDLIFLYTKLTSRLENYPSYEQIESGLRLRLYKDITE